LVKKENTGSRVSVARTWTKKWEKEVKEKVLDFVM
jgi:hypothetical protein